MLLPKPKLQTRPSDWPSAMIPGKVCPLGKGTKFTG
jgi:hypothetical protein